MVRRPVQPDRPVLFDLSPPIGPSLAVWPGDTPPSREILLDLRRGDAVTLSTLRATVHLGAHVDAPWHFQSDGPTVDRLPLEPFIGPCQVVRPPLPADRTLAPGAWTEGVRAPRVLLDTGTHPDPSTFPRTFAALSPDLVEALAEAGVVLLGVDTPSVDPFDSKTLPAHQACGRLGVAILEGLNLRDVPEGHYELIALPLRLEGFDASPVRAVLRAAP